MQEKIVNQADVDEFVKKSMDSYKKTEKETMDNKIVQEVIKSYSAGGCNYRGGINP